MANWTTEYFGPTLLTKKGLLPTGEVLANKSRIGIYFSAHWCPPCRGFTPVLAEFFEELEEEDGSALQIVYASSDNDESSFEEYYGKMPWAAIPFATGSNFIQNLGEKFSVRGIPHLVILHAADGAVVDSDGRSTVANAKGVIANATAKWA